MSWINQSKSALNEQIKKYDDLLSNKINKDTECTKLGKVFTFFKTDWETLNIQVTELKLILSKSQVQPNKSRTIILKLLKTRINNYAI